MMPSRVTWTGLLLLIVALVGYFLPWYTHETAGFTMNGWDIAEWSSLHPAVRSESPAMLTSLLLRLPHVVIAFGLAILANCLQDGRIRWIVRIGAMAWAIRMMPPWDFLTSASDDLNYRQMAMLTGVGLVSVLVAIGLGRSFQRLQVLVMVGVLIIAGGSGLSGVSRVGNFLDGFEIDVTVGVGLALYLAAVLGMSGVLAGHLFVNMRRRHVFNGESGRTG